jgi:hypothetical protein
MPRRRLFQLSPRARLYPSRCIASGMEQAGKQQETMPETDMRSEIAKLEGALAAMTAESQVGAGLQKQYAEVLRNPKE